MRLIDVDVLIRYFKTLQAINSADVLFCEDLEDFIDHIEELPTAYDIDKIMKQLEEASYCIDVPASANIHNPFEKSVYRGIALDRAIEIVRKGGNV